MADWSLPTVTSTYTNLVAEAKARDTDAAVGLDPAATTVTNPVTNMIRWTSASNKWQKYNGSTWVDLTATYNIDVAYFGGQAPSYYAPLASPVFTGNPTAPTQAVDNNTTRLATTEFVLAQRGTATPIVDGTGAAGSSYRYSSQDHVHPTDTSRAPLASPTFTGTATTPGLNVTTTFQLGGVEVTSSAAELNYNDITTLGTAQPSKVVTTNATNDSTGMRHLTISGTGTFPTANITTVNLSVSAGDVVVKRCIGTLGTALWQCYTTTYPHVTELHEGIGRYPTQHAVLFTAIASGTVRITFDHFGGPSRTSYVRLNKNGVEIIAYSVTSASASRSYDMSVSIGDVVTLQQRVDNAAGYSAVGNCFIKASVATPCVV